MVRKIEYQPPQPSRDPRIQPEVRRPSDPRFQPESTVRDPRIQWDESARPAAGEVVMARVARAPGKDPRIQPEGLVVDHRLPPASLGADESRYLLLGEHVSYRARASLSDGTSLDVTSLVHWSSSDVGVIVVSDDPSAAGMAVASTIGGGFASVFAGLGAALGTSRAIVGDGRWTALEISGPSSLPVGGMARFRAINTDLAGGHGDVSGTVTWTSSDTSVATVDSLGLVSARAAGLADISASNNCDLLSSATLHVTP